MADVLGTNYTKFTNPTAENRVAAGKLGGRVRSITDDFTFSGEAIASTLKIGRDLRKGAVIHGISFQFAALGGATTMRIGDSNDDDRYMTDIATAAAGIVTDLNIAGNQYVIGTNTGDETIVLLTAGGAVTGVVKVTVYYSED